MSKKAVELLQKRKRLLSFYKGKAIPPSVIKQASKLLEEAKKAGGLTNEERYLM